MLQPGLGQSPKPVAAHSQRHSALIHRAFATRPNFVTLLELICLLISPGLLNSLVFFLGAYRKFPTVSFVLGALGTVLARLTILSTETDINDWFPGSIKGELPIDTGFSRWTGGFLVGPIDLEVS